MRACRGRSWRSRTTQPLLRRRRRRLVRSRIVARLADRRRSASGVGRRRARRRAPVIRHRAGGRAHRRSQPARRRRGWRRMLAQAATVRRAWHREGYSGCWLLASAAGAEDLQRHVLRPRRRRRPSGPTHDGQPDSQGQPAMSSRVCADQVAVHPEQRLAEPDAARVVVVDEDARLVAVLERRRPTTRPARRRRAPARRSAASRGRADRHADVVRVAHQQQLRDLPHRVRQPDHAVPAVVAARRAARVISSRGIVSQYDVVCICCSGRSSSPEPTFSLV
ncbi:MAG: hypothetical protein MZV64_14040 [Ignavibacteriales bacterium]|nr:hypothetical protein [Ignavibacteriales bacterium]